MTRIDCRPGTTHFGCVVEAACTGAGIPDAIRNRKTISFLIDTMVEVPLYIVIMIYNQSIKKP
jgi:hypothetical protein